MKKQDNKHLVSQMILKSTFILITISLILKLLGSEIFYADAGNKFLNFIIILLDKYKIELIVTSLFFYAQVYLMFKFVSKNNKKLIYHFFTIIVILLSNTIYSLEYHFFNGQNHIGIYYLLFFSILFLICSVIIDINCNKEKFLKYIFDKAIVFLKLALLIVFYQILVLFVRNITYYQTYDSIYILLLNIDFMILFIASYYFHTYRDSNKQRIKYFSHKLLLKMPSRNKIKRSLKSISSNLENFKKLSKFDKIVFIIFAFLFVVSELFNLFLVIFIAYINNAMIESFFIITSFIISRQVFGAFHLDSAVKCWFVSNISFFILNKLSVGVEISIVIPIVIGTLFALLMSKFIKDTTNELYRGIPLEDLEKIIQGKKLTKIEKGILIDFYSNKITITKLTRKYNYSKTMIHEYKNKALNKI